MGRFHVALAAVGLVAAAASGHSYSTYAKWPSSPVTFYVNPATPDLSSTAAIEATQFALNVWNTQGGSPFRFQYGGTNGDTTTAYDQRNVVIFRNVSNGSTIATTYSWWDGSNRLVDSDVIVWDGLYTFFTGTSGCGGGSNAAYLEDILAHEFGHALGLNHSAVAEATMYPSYSYCSQEMRTLASDDIAGLQSLYGVSATGNEGGATVPRMSSPVTGSTLAGSSQTFTWTAGSGVSSYWLYVGTAVGANNLVDRDVGSSVTATLTGLPTDSRTIYVRLWWKAGSWGFADYAYTAANTGGGGGGGGGVSPAITTPGAGATLTGSSQTFTWTAGSGATSFWLYLGSAVGGYDLFAQSMGLGLTAGVTGLPTDGRRIHARLWWLRNAAWEYADTTYTAAGSGSTSTNPAMTTPAPGSTLSGSSQTFAWTAGTGVSSYWLYLGSAVGGGDLFNQDLGSRLSVTAGGLPTDGRPIYARLWWRRNSGWEYADSSYNDAATTSAGWFVAPSGTGNGSSAAPFGRIQDALAVAQPGDHINIRSGTYNESVSTVRNGSSGQPITLVAVDGRSTVLVTTSGRVFTVSHSHIAVDGMVFDGQYGADDLVRLSGNAHFFELRNSELRRSSRDLIDMGAVQGVTIFGSLLHHALNPTNGGSDAHGIAAAAVTDLTIRDSEIHTFSGDGLQVDPGRAAPGWNRVTVERTRIWLARG